MAFTGTKVVTSLGPNMVRMTDVIVGAGTSGTIGLDGDTGADIQLPANFSRGTPGNLTLSDLVKVSSYLTDVGAAAAHLHLAKTEGPFRITITNDLANPATLELYIHYINTLTR